MPTVAESALVGVETGTDAEITGPAPLAGAGPNDVAFAGEGTPVDEVMACRAGVVLVGPGVDADALESLASAGVVAVQVPRPRLSFIRVMERFFAQERPVGIDPMAVIDPSAQIGSRVYVGPGCTIDESVTVGDDTVIDAGVHLYPRVSLGARVSVHSGAIIGVDGFGYERDDDGALQRFPHLGTVVIEDDVVIGANTCIARGALDATRIGRGSKIDNLVHIGHNAVVGPDSMVIAHAMIGGSVRIGPRAWIAPAAAVRNTVEVGADALVGLGSVVTKDVEPGTVVMGVPARPVESDEADRPAE